MPHRASTDGEVKVLPILDISDTEGKWEPSKLSKGYFDLEIALERLMLDMIMLSLQIDMVVSCIEEQMCTV